MLLANSANVSSCLSSLLTLTWYHALAVLLVLVAVLASHLQRRRDEAGDGRADALTAMEEGQADAALQEVECYPALPTAQVAVGPPPGLSLPQEPVAQLPEVQPGLPVLLGAPAAFPLPPGLAEAGLDLPLARCAHEPDIEAPASPSPLPQVELGVPPGLFVPAAFGPPPGLTEVCLGPPPGLCRPQQEACEAEPPQGPEDVWQPTSPIIRHPGESTLPIKLHHEEDWNFVEREGYGAWKGITLQAKDLFDWRRPSMLTAGFVAFHDFHWASREEGWNVPTASFPPSTYTSWEKCRRGGCLHEGFARGFFAGLVRFVRNVPSSDPESEATQSRLE
ncbi:unnamed protein product [Symbiodinium sp. CCMP2456]|nr:unnamed protein product [Symbiodinium sp. CCMP2456]